MSDEWISTQWMHKSQVDDTDCHDAVTITRSISPFYEGIRYAVRRGAFVLSVKGKLQYEPIPSSRTDAFYKRFRFTSFADACAVAEEYIADRKAKVTP